MRTITPQHIQRFRDYLIAEEKSENTQQKYLRDVTAFAAWLGTRAADKAAVLAYKQMLVASYAPASVNAALSSLNSFFTFLEWHDCRVKMLKIQRQIFANREKELTKAEYERLLSAAKQRKNQRLYYLMQTVCSTGIRISELRFVTVDAVKAGQALIHCKGKMRLVILPAQLCRLLRAYIAERHIKSGAVFVTQNGKPLDRSNIWSDMKKLCAVAGVPETKVFPHNLRHLFARTYYSMQKDVVRLADILGHSSVNTTRIYTMETGETHRKQLQRLGLLMC